MQKGLILIMLGLFLINCSAPIDKKQREQEMIDSIQNVLVKKLEIEDCLTTTWEEYLSIKKGEIPSYCISEDVVFEIPKCPYYVGEKYSRFDAIEHMSIKKIFRKDNSKIIAYVVKYTVEGECDYFPIPHLNSERKVIKAFYEDLENFQMLGLAMWLGVLDWSK